ncbi:MAG: type II toxin-antitoxin system RelE/ParE family toxin [Clostridiales bacterium]|nr:type II toxin-antitoxin system RelE/ParE family toxin [Clostridiales bacterium]
MIRVIFLPPASKFLKKLKDKKLKLIYKTKIDELIQDPYIGEMKMGDLSGLYGVNIYYNKTNYELAYTIEEEPEETLVIVHAGTRENFYDELKRYMKSK